MIGLNCIENMIAKDKLLIFKNHKSRQQIGKKEDESLFYIWYDLSSPVTQPKDDMDQGDADVNILRFHLNICNTYYT